MADKPKVTWFAFGCPKCKHEWVERLEMPIGLKAFLDRLDAWGKRCPECGNKPRKGSQQAIVLFTGPEHERVMRDKGLSDHIADAKKMVGGGS